MSYVDTFAPNCPVELSNHTPDILNSKDNSNNSETIVLLHGNPTSSYLWRNIIPTLSSLGRCLAPDLIGMGNSDASKTDLTTRYTLQDHANHLDKWFDNTIPDSNNTNTTETKIHLIIQDWGSALGLDWAARNPHRVASITFFEAVLESYPNWDAFPSTGTKIFQAMRTPSIGEIIVLEKNTFLKKILPASMLRTLSPTEFDIYNKRYEHSSTARLPTLVWPRQIPFEKEGCESAREIVNNYAAFHQSSNIPKCYIGKKIFYTVFFQLLNQLYNKLCYFENT